MKKLLIATGNPAKKKMYLEILKGIKIKLFFLDDFVNIPPSPDENEDTVEQNSLLKAKYYFNHFWIPCIWDDAWLSINDLDWEPWVKARRWWWILSDDISDEDWIKFFLKKVSSIKKEPFDWYFPYSRCLYMWADNYLFQTWKIEVQFSHIKQREPKSGWPLSSYIIDDDYSTSLERRWKKEFLEFINEKFL